MHFFLLLFIPAATFCLVYAERKFSVRQMAFPIFLGFFTGLIVSLFTEFFIYPEKNTGGTFFSLFLQSLPDASLPQIIITAAFFFFSKDGMKYKSSSMIPLLGAFNSIFIPYMTFTQGEPDSFFMSFANPVLAMETVIFYSCAVKHGIHSFFNKNPAGISTDAVLVMLSLFIQPAMVALWHLHSFTAGVYFITLILVPASIFALKFVGKQENSLDNDR